MLNNNLLCRDITGVEKTASGFVMSKEEKFKKLEVIETSEEDIPKGCVVKVHKNSGEETEEYGGAYIVINRRDVISIL